VESVNIERWLNLLILIGLTTFFTHFIEDSSYFINDTGGTESGLHNKMNHATFAIMKAQDLET